MKNVSLVLCVVGLFWLGLEIEKHWNNWSTSKPENCQEIVRRFNTLILQRLDIRCDSTAKAPDCIETMMAFAKNPELPAALLELRDRGYEISISCEEGNYATTNSKTGRKTLKILCERTNYDHDRKGLLFAIKDLS